MSAAHDANGITDPQQFGQVGTDKNDGLTLQGQLVYQLVDLRLAPDVNAAGRFIQKENISLMMQETANGDLLLVAP